MYNIFENIINKIKNKNKLEYHEVGKEIIWDELKKLFNKGYKYFHYSNKVDGSRDKYGLWIDTSRAFSSNKIDYDDEQNMMFFVIYNSDVSDDIKNMTENQLLNDNTNFSYFIKKTLI